MLLETVKTRNREIIEKDSGVNLGLAFTGELKKQKDSRQMQNWPSCYWIGKQLMTYSFLAGCSYPFLMFGCVRTVVDMILASEVVF